MSNLSKVGGHKALKCYHRFDISSNSTPSNQAHQALIVEPTTSSLSQDWFLDSSATTHVTLDVNYLSAHQTYTGSVKVFIDNGSGLYISHIDILSISTSSGSLLLKNVLCVPYLTKNLLSVSQLTKDNHVTVEFISNSCFVKDLHTQTVILHGTLCNELYKITPYCTPHQVTQLTSSADT
jgi:hypothetical protein